MDIFLKCKAILGGASRAKTHGAMAAARRTRHVRHVGIGVRRASGAASLAAKGAMIAAGAGAMALACTRLPIPYGPQTAAYAPPAYAGSALPVDYVPGVLGGSAGYGVPVYGAVANGGSAAPYVPNVAPSGEVGGGSTPIARGPQAVSEPNSGLILLGVLAVCAVFAAIRAGRKR